VLNFYEIEVVINILSVFAADNQVAKLFCVRIVLHARKRFCQKFRQKTCGYVTNTLHLLCEKN